MNMLSWLKTQGYSFKTVDFDDFLYLNVENRLKIYIKETTSPELAQKFFNLSPEQQEDNADWFDNISRRLLKVETEPDFLDKLLEVDFFNQPFKVILSSAPPEVCIVLKESEISKTIEIPTDFEDGRICRRKEEGTFIFMVPSFELYQKWRILLGDLHEVSYASHSQIELPIQLKWKTQIEALG